MRLYRRFKFLLGLCSLLFSRKSLGCFFEIALRRFTMRALFGFVALADRSIDRAGRITFFAKVFIPDFCFFIPAMALHARLWAHCCLQLSLLRSLELLQSFLVVWNSTEEGTARARYGFVALADRSSSTYYVLSSSLRFLLYSCYGALSAIMSALLLLINCRCKYLPLDRVWSLIFDTVLFLIYFYSARALHVRLWAHSFYQSPFGVMSST